MVFGERKIRFDRRGPVSGAEAQIFIERIGINLLARIHFPGGVPYALELAEGFHQFRAEHSDKKLATGLTVAMFAGERAAHLHDHVGGFFHEGAKILNAFFRD